MLFHPFFVCVFESTLCVLQSTHRGIESAEAARNPRFHVMAQLHARLILRALGGNRGLIKRGTCGEPLLQKCAKYVGERVLSQKIAGGCLERNPSFEGAERTFEDTREESPSGDDVSGAQDRISRLAEVLCPLSSVPLIVVGKTYYCHCARIIIIIIIIMIRRRNTVCAPCGVFWWTTKCEVLYNYYYQA
jgi:hypothetical protein